ncbi:MAG: FkbM family methyltransferase [Proteobacteria bacterium]|nr:FkbM family methyltransferase [Pseudomonadota bacterium]
MTFDSMHSHHTDPPFGFHQASTNNRKLITMAQQSPHNWFGRICALMVRKYIKNKHPEWIDVEVEGFRLRSNITDNVSERKYIFMPWLFDPVEHKYMQKNLSKNSVFIDIGANAGIYTLWAAQLLGKEGTILSFEPNPIMFERLIKNISFNKTEKWPRLHLCDQAVSDQSGDLSLYLDPVNFGGSSLLQRNQTDSKISVSAITLVEKVKSLKLKQIDLLKIDIEGAEERALLPFFKQASDQLLPKAIIIENSDDLWETDLNKTFKKYHYKLIQKTRMNSIWQRS